MISITLNKSEEEKLLYLLTVNRVKIKLKEFQQNQQRVLECDNKKELKLSHFKKEVSILIMMMMKMIIKKENKEIQKMKLCTRLLTNLKILLIGNLIIK